MARKAGERDGGTDYHNGARAVSYHLGAAMLEHQIKSGRLSPAMSFNQKVWALCARVPKGKVTTYGEIARALNTKAYRAVGNALNKNPYAPQVPCHRVVGASGALTGFAGGVALKRKMLKAEGIEVVNDRVDVGRIFSYRS